MKQTILNFSFLVTALAVVAIVPMKAAEVGSAATNSPAVTNQVLLDDLVNEALAKNPELNFYRAEIAAARGGRKSAGAWANPEVSAEIGQKRVKDSSGTLLGEGAAWAISVNQTFEYPGRLCCGKPLPTVTFNSRSLASRNSSSRWRRGCGRWATIFTLRRKGSRRRAKWLTAFRR